MAGVFSYYVVSFPSMTLQKFFVMFDEKAIKRERSGRKFSDGY